MSMLGASAGYGLLVAASLIAGALAAAVLKLPPRVAATLTAFGGGTLLAAVGLELVPEADEAAGPWLTASSLLVGALVYVAADAWLARDDEAEAVRRSGSAAAAGQPMMMRDDAEVARGEAIAAGLFIDGVPESIALGLTVAQGQVGLALLAGILIGNIVEAYGAAQPIIGGGRTPRFAVGLLTAIGLVLAGATALGGGLLADVSPWVMGTAQGLAAGAVIAVISISVLPHAFEQVSGASAIATTLGFGAGYLLS